MRGAYTLQARGKGGRRGGEKSISVKEEGMIERDGSLTLRLKPGVMLVQGTDALRLVKMGTELILHISPFFPLSPLRETGSIPKCMS